MPKKSVINLPVYPVNQSCREYLLHVFPVLREHEDAIALRGIAGYLLFSTFYDEYSERLVFPYDDVKKHVGLPKHAKGFKARDWIKKFHNNVWRVLDHGYDRFHGKARQVTSLLDDIHLRNIEMLEFSLNEKTVDLITGNVISTRHEQLLRSEMKNQIKYEKHHPAIDLLYYLNSQSQTVLRKTLSSNWDSVISTYHEYHNQEARREYAFSCLSSLRHARYQYYKTVPRTSRIYSIASSINYLPRELRTCALSSCIQLDIKSAQLAIVAKLWELPKTQSFLHHNSFSWAGVTIWEDLCSYMGVNKNWKSFFKDALYSIIFGRSLRDLRFFLKTGLKPIFRKHRRIKHKIPKCYLGNDDNVDYFLKHPLIAELLAAQQLRLAEIKRDGYIIEVSGQKRYLNLAQKVDEKSLLAAEVQSYEVDLMLSLLPVLKRYNYVRVLSFLHDGMTIKLANNDKETTNNKVMSEMNKAFSTRAKQLGMYASLEFEYLGSK